MINKTGVYIYIYIKVSFSVRPYRARRSPPSRQRRVRFYFNFLFYFRDEPSGDTRAVPRHCRRGRDRREFCLDASINKRNARAPKFWTSRGVRFRNIQTPRRSRIYYMCVRVCIVRARRMRIINYYIISSRATFFIYLYILSPVINRMGIIRRPTVRWLCTYNV